MNDLEFQKACDDLHLKELAEYMQATNCVWADLGRPPTEQEIQDHLNDLWQSLKANPNPPDRAEGGFWIRLVDQKTTVEVGFMISNFFEI